MRVADLKEVSVVDVAEGVGPGERLHDLLLVMTGRVDDDAVNTTREMLGTASSTPPPSSWRGACSRAGSR